jgi:phage tail-like protein
MTQFTVNANRQDPYKNFKFRVRWDGKVVAGVSKISGLKRVTEVVSHREGGDPSHSHLSPGQWKFEPITLERGVTHDAEFEKWANLTHALGADPEMSLKNFRKDIVIELLNEQGTVVKAWKVYRCWVSEYQLLPDLDANANAIALERLTLQNEGWERDTSVVEPAET